MNKLTKIKLGVTTAMVALAVGAPAFAVESGGSAVVTAIQEQSAALISDGATVIAAGIGIGAVFFGAKMLWGKFKSMAK